MYNIRCVTIMLPVHFHDVTYDHIWSKILQELKISPARKTRASITLKVSNTFMIYEQLNYEFMPI